MGSASGNIERFWGKVPVVDATKELRVFILPEDVRNACPKDESNCVFALACKRACGASRVLFFRTRAYVELPDRKGNMRVERFAMPHEMRQLIANFDQGKPIPDNAGFVLVPPSASYKLDYIAKSSSIRRKRRAEGVPVRSNKLAGTRRNPDPMQHLVRNGGGKVQFVNESRAAGGEA